MPLVRRNPTVRAEEPSQSSTITTPRSAVIRRSRGTALPAKVGYSEPTLTPEVLTPLRRRLSHPSSPLVSLPSPSKVVAGLFSGEKKMRRVQKVGQAEPHWYMETTTDHDAIYTLARRMRIPPATLEVVGYQ